MYVFCPLKSYTKCKKYRFEYIKYISTKTICTWNILYVPFSKAFTKCKKERFAKSKPKSTNIYQFFLHFAYFFISILLPKKNTVWDTWNQNLYYINFLYQFIAYNSCLLNFPPKICHTYIKNLKSAFSVFVYHPPSQKFIQDVKINQLIIYYLTFIYYLSLDIILNLEQIPVIENLSVTPEIHPRKKMTTVLTCYAS